MHCPSASMYLAMEPEPEDQSPATARRMEVLPAPLAPVMSSEVPCLTCSTVLASRPLLWTQTGTALACSMDV